MIRAKTRQLAEEARRIGDEIGVDWSHFDAEQFRAAWTLSLALTIPD